MEVFYSYCDSIGAYGWLRQMKRYVIELSLSERRDLQGLVTKGKASARKIQHAQILLKADESEKGPAWKDQDIADAFEVSVRTIERIRKRCVEHGLEDALVHRKNPNGIQRRKLDGRGEAHLCKLACSKPPKGRESWTLQLLGDRLVELKVVDSISRETVRTTLKKTN